jgi:hypothetical protein
VLQYALELTGRSDFMRRESLAKNSRDGSVRGRADTRAGEAPATGVRKFRNPTMTIIMFAESE